MASSEGDQLLAGVFYAILDEIETDKYFKLQRSGIGNESSYIKNTFFLQVLLWFNSFSVLKKLRSCFLIETSEPSKYCVAKDIFYIIDYLYHHSN